MKRSVKIMLTFLVAGTVLFATTAPVLAAQSAEENHVAPYFSPAPENSEKEVIDVIRWDNIPGNDSELLLKFLCYTFDINWTENATICKSDDSKTIIISTDDHSAEIIIMDESDEVATLKTDDGRTCKLTIVKEDGKLCISRILPCRDVILLEDSDNFSFEDSVLIHSNAVPAEVIVGFKDGITAREQESIIGLHRGKILEREPALNAVLVQVSAAHAFIARITKERTVEYAQPNYMRKALNLKLGGGLLYNFSFRGPGYIPNDPRWDDQYNLRLINVDYTWKREKGDKSIKVAIVDTGIQYDHPDLKGNYISGGYDWVNDDSNPYDDNGHGTHCAGIVAAQMDNRKGITGIAQVSLMAEKVVDENGEGNVWDSVRGIIHAADEGANILSLSHGTTVYFSIYEDACQYAWNAGCLLIAASGNSGIRPIAYPARFDTVIAVGAIDKNKQRYSDSNYGPELELVAPGVDIISTSPTDDYDWYSGTSTATPHVAGVAALLWSERPSRTNYQIRFRLHDDAMRLGWHDYYGYGLVNSDITLKMEDLSPPFQELSYSDESAIYVPDNYTTIQDAVTAPPDDYVTIILRDGFYEESVLKEEEEVWEWGGTFIRSENGPTNCIVQAASNCAVFAFVPNSVFSLTDHTVSISGLTITRDTSASRGNGISLGPFFGSGSSFLRGTLKHRIFNNICTNHVNGICLHCNLFDSISNNTCTKNGVGISLHNSDDNYIYENACTKNGVGISLQHNSDDNYIYENACTKNGVGISLHNSDDNCIYTNIFSNNEHDGISLSHSSHNYICFNNFINNTENVNSSESTNNTWNTKEKISYNYNGVVYKNHIGNYWDDYEGTDGDGDGIGDIPYVIDSDNKDLYPLMGPFENYQTSDLTRGMPPNLFGGG